MNAFFGELGSGQLVLWVINVLIHSTVLTAVLLCVAMLFRKRAAMRYWILCCGLMLVLVSPAVSAVIQSQGRGWLALAVPNETAPAATVAASPRPPLQNELPTEQKPLLQRSVSITSSMQDVDSTGQVASSAARTETMAPAEVLVEPSAGTPENARSPMLWLASIVSIATIIWAVGAVFLLLRMAIGWTRLSRILRRAKPIKDPAFVTAFTKACALAGCSEQRTPRLLASDEISGPLAAGIFGGSVVLPKRLIAESSPIEFAEVLIHEVAHVVRRDPIVVLLQNFVAAIYWPHPMVRMLNRELAKAREEVCDNFVLATTDAPIYSRTLLSLMQLIQQPETIPGSVGFFASRWKLEQRVAGLLDETRDRRTILSRRGWSFVLASTLGLLTAICFGTVTIATAQVSPQTSTEEPAAIQTDVANSSAIDDQQPSEKGRAKTVRGRVVNEAGEPVAGAKLWLPLYHEERSVVQTTADDRGNFELRCPANWISARVTGSGWTVWAYAPGYSIQAQDAYEVIRGNSEREYTIRLPPQRDTRFKILAPDQQPLTDVMVQPRIYKTSAGTGLVPSEVLSLVSSRTDANGVATLPGIQSDLLFRIETESRQFGRQAIRVDGNADEPDREIRLKPTASISGRLVAQNPEWVRGVKLSFTTDSENESKNPEGIAGAITDDEGRFEVPIIASGGSVRTYVFLDPKLPVRPRLRRDHFLTAGETMQLEIPLMDASRVHGKVLAKSTGKPVANAEISLGYGDFRQSDQVITDENGRYESRALPGRVLVQIIALPDGLVQLGEPRAESYQVPADVGDFELPTIEVVGSRPLIGRLIDANDQPLLNIGVLAVKGNRRYGFGISGAKGQFMLRIPDGVDTHVEVYTQERGQQPVDVVQQDPLIVRYTFDVREEEVEPERALKRDVTLTGRVLSAGEPVKDTKVTLNRSVPVGLSSSGRSGSRSTPVSEATTDATGNYRLVGLKAGDDYQIEIDPSFLAVDPSWRHQSPYFQSLPDDAKDEVVLPDVNLLKLSQSIAGSIVDLDGKPVEGATVNAQLRDGGQLARMTNSGPPPWTMTDHQGRFALQELPDLPLSIMAYFANPNGGPIRFPANVDVDLNQQDIRVVLDPSLQEDQE